MTGSKTNDKPPRARRRKPTGPTASAPSRSRRPASRKEAAQTQGDLLDRLTRIEVEARVRLSHLNLGGYPKIKDLLISALVAHVTKVTRPFRGRKLDLETGLRKWLLFLDARGLALAFRAFSADCSTIESRPALIQAVNAHWERMWPGYSKDGQALRNALEVDSCLSKAVDILLSESDHGRAEETRDAMSARTEQKAVEAGRRLLHELGRDADLSGATLDDLRVSGQSAAARFFGTFPATVDSVSRRGSCRTPDTSPPFLETVRAVLDEQFTRG